MFKNIILYNCSFLSSVNAYEFGKKIFQLINLEIDLVGYFIFDKNNDLNLIETNIENFENKIIDPKSAFNLSGSINSKEALIIGYMNKNFDSFSYINILINLELITNEDLSLISKYIEQFDFFSYGINFNSKDLFESMSYISGQSFINLFSYEDSYLWEEELNNGFFDSDGSFKKIRLVYEQNFIDQELLKKLINGTVLSEYILSNTNFGSLNKVKGRLWLWKVESSQLEYVNSILNEADLLVSWRRHTSNKFSNKLT